VHCYSALSSLSLEMTDNSNEPWNCRKLDISCSDQIWASTWSSACFIALCKDGADFLIAVSCMSKIKVKKNIKEIFPQINLDK